MRWIEIWRLPAIAVLIVIGSVCGCAQYEVLFSSQGEDSEPDVVDECGMTPSLDPPFIPSCSRPYREPMVGEAEPVYQGEITGINRATMDYAILLDSTVEGMQLLPADSRPVLPPIEGAFKVDYSSDGKYMAYCRLHEEEVRVFLHDLETQEVRQIDRLDSYRVLEFSPDASRLIYAAHQPSGNEMRELRLPDLTVIHRVTNVHAAWYTRKQGHLFIKKYRTVYPTLLIATNGGEPRHIADDVHSMFLTPDESTVYLLHGGEEYCNEFEDPWDQSFGPRTLEVVPLTSDCPPTILATDAIDFKPTYSEGRVLVFGGQMSHCGTHSPPTNLKLVEADGESWPIAGDVVTARFLDGNTIDAVWYLNSDGEIRIHRLHDGAESAVGRGLFHWQSEIPPDGTPAIPLRFSLRAVPGTDLALVLAVPVDGDETDTTGPLSVVDLSTFEQTTLIDSAVNFDTYEHQGRTALLLFNSHSAEDNTHSLSWADPWNAPPREFPPGAGLYRVHEYAEGLALYLGSGENHTLSVSFPAGEPLVPITDRFWYFGRYDSHPCDLLVYRYLEGEEWRPRQNRHDILISDPFGRGTIEVANAVDLSTVLRDAETNELVFVTGTHLPPDSGLSQVNRIRVVSGQ